MHETWCIYMYVYVCTYREHRKELTDFKLQDKEIQEAKRDSRDNFKQY